MIHICKVVRKYLESNRSQNLPLLSCKLFNRKHKFGEVSWLSGLIFWCYHVFLHTNMFAELKGRHVTHCSSTQMNLEIKEHQKGKGCRENVWGCGRDPVSPSAAPLTSTGL